jgi:hypothetical protein
MFPPPPSHMAVLPATSTTGTRAINSSALERWMLGLGPSCERGKKRGEKRGKGGEEEKKKGALAGLAAKKRWRRG